MFLPCLLGEIVIILAFAKTSHIGIKPFLNLKARGRTGVRDLCYAQIVVVVSDR